jgi:hypothetical protein
MIHHRYIKLFACAACALFYLLLVYYLSRISYNDPTGIFFDARIAYQAPISSIYQKSALRTIRSLQAGTIFRKSTNNAPYLCIGMPSIMRRNEQYMHYAVGSLFHGLTEKERQEIKFMPMIANMNFTQHYAYQQWLENVADEILVYNQTSPEFHWLSGLELEQNYWKKALHDYTTSLRGCWDSGAKFIAMVEDDIIACPEWYSLLKAALEKSNSYGPCKCGQALLLQY